MDEDSVVFNASGAPFARLEIGLSGTVAGWTVRAPSMHHNNVTDGPGLIFPQLEVTGEPERCTARYEARAGSGLSLFVPLEAAGWNGKLIVTAHGGSSYGRVGTPAPHFGAFRPLANLNKYVGTMIDKGYAVAHTRRSAAIAVQLGDMRVTFADGSEQDGFHIGTHAGILVEWAQLAQARIAERMGRTPSHTYLYGFSSGAMQGRLLNYVPGINAGAAGLPVFTGLLLDDCGGGVPMPVEAPDPARFVPQIDLTHALYTAPEGPPVLENKRANARLLLEYGLGERSRHYELAGVSHFDAGYGPEDMGRGRDSVAHTIDLAPLMSAMIDRLDAWVTHGTPPPPSGHVALPEVAAPLGVYYAYPAELGDARVSLQTTGFAAYDGRNLEPLDGLGRLVDMNGSGVRERRETLSAAWARLGLIAAGSSVDRSVYVERVAAVARTLAAAGFIDPASTGWYVTRAQSALICG